MLRYLLASLVLHGAVYCVALPAKQRHPIAVEVTIKTRDVAPKSKQKKLKLTPVPTAPRLGSDAYRHGQRKMGDVLASEHYLERLHAHVDPNWRTFVNRTRVVAFCQTVLNIDADANGTVLTVVVVQTTCPTLLTAAAVDAVKYCNLLPPPKMFLDKQGILKLEWSFTLKRKDT